MQPKSIMHKSMLLCAGLFLCAVLTGCGLQSKNQINTNDCTKKVSVKNFNLQQNLPHYELYSVNLGRVFTDDFNNYIHFKGNHNLASDSPNTFILCNDKNSIAFSNSSDLPYIALYDKRIPNLKSQLYKHSLTIIQNNKNITYKLYDVKHSVISWFIGKSRIINGYRITLIPIKYQFKSHHENYINYAHGKHHLIHLVETDQLDHAYYKHNRYDNLPNN